MRPVPTDPAQDGADSYLPVLPPYVTTPNRKVPMETPTMALPPRRALLAAAVLLLSACGDPGAAADAGPGVPAATAPPVRVALVEADSLSLPLEATGTLGPRELVPLSFSVPGVVATLSSEPGDAVLKGARMASLDLREIDAEVTQAEEGHAKAARDLARLERLLEDRVVPRVQVDDARTAFEMARSTLEQARVAREYAELRAPGDGVVLRRLVEPGTRVQPGEPVLLVGTGDGAVFRVALPDRDRVRVTLGDRAGVLLAALPERHFPGRVTRLGALADPVTGTFPVEITLDDPTGLPAGLTGRAEILPGEGAPVVRIPAEALLEANGGEGSVLVLERSGDRARRRTVPLAAVTSRGVLVAGALAVGERVVVEGGAWVVDGQAVRVLP